MAVVTGTGSLEEPSTVVVPGKLELFSIEQAGGSETLPVDGINL